MLDVKQGKALRIWKWAVSSGRNKTKHLFHPSLLQHKGDRYIKHRYFGPPAVAQLVRDVYMSVREFEYLVKEKKSTNP